MQVAIVGGGRVGLPTALSLARIGHTTVVYDTDASRVASLVAGSVPFFEPGLDDALFEQVTLGRLRFTVDPTEALTDARVVFICVDTPMGPDGHADLRAVEAAASTIARCARGTVVVVTKSTVPLGTGEWLQDLLDERADASEPLVASNPEFLQEGLALNEALRPSRILVGSGSDEAKRVLREVYAPFVDAGATYLETDLATAELTKYASNAFLAMKISFANALAEICDVVGADVVTLTRALGVDPRIGPGHLHAGLGYGGACLGKDLSALRGSLHERGVEVELLDVIERINDRAVDRVTTRVREALGDLSGRTVVLLGLAFKPGTDDVRSAPALRLAAELLAAGASVTGYDPRACDAAQRSLPELRVSEDLYGALAGADCAVICTEWDEIKALDLDRARATMARPLLIDGRNVLDPDTAAAAGFVYRATGRPTPSVTVERASLLHPV